MAVAEVGRAPAGHHESPGAGHEPDSPPGRGRTAVDGPSAWSSGRWEPKRRAGWCRRRAAVRRAGPSGQPAVHARAGNAPAVGEVCAGSTACRWRSRWQRPAWQSCRPRRSPRSRTGSRSWSCPPSAGQPGTAMEASIDASHALLSKRDQDVRAALGVRRAVRPRGGRGRGIRPPGRRARFSRPSRPWSKPRCSPGTKRR